MLEGVLAGQKALVTGANSGIGKAVAIGLAKAGANVVVNYVVDEPAAGLVVCEIERCGSRGLAIKADVSSEHEVEEMFAQAIRAFGTLDILVANAGLQRDSDINEMTLAQWQEVLAVNLT